MFLEKNTLFSVAIFLKNLEKWPNNHGSIGNEESATYHLKAPSLTRANNYSSSRTHCERLKSTYCYESRQRYQ